MANWVSVRRALEESRPDPRLVSDQQAPGGPETHQGGKALRVIAEKGLANFIGYTVASHRQLWQIQIEYNDGAVSVEEVSECRPDARDARANTENQDSKIEFFITFASVGVLTMSYLRKAREWAYPTLKSSAFLEKGVLTPEEFVRAGDELVFKCPTWSWEGGDPKRAKSYLPPEKQYLVTRNVPCQLRVSSMENTMTLTAEEGDGDEDWLVSAVVQEKPLEDEFDILDDEGEVVPKEEAKKGEEEEEDDEYADMADFEDDNVLEDDAVAPSAEPEESNIVQTRTYDLSITYDKYYQTPRVWMMGYTAETQQPLTGKEMLEDVISDYANRTVTIETHPHVSGPHASIHPCQHGKVMKVIVRNLMKSTDDGEEGPAVETYLFIFLKFVNSIIPTINYDFTMDVTADTRK